MPKTKAWAALSPTTPLVPFEVDRREPGPADVVIDIACCGVCHSDIHQARNEWGGSLFPMVPGHEIVGTVTRVGSAVTRFKAGDLAGVGCMVDSCRTCDSCRRDLEQFCWKGAAFTYNGTEMDRKTPTFGGYSKQVVVTETFVLGISPKLDLAGAAPLLCAGITTWSPLRHWKAGPGQRVGVVGLGGLGHMAVKLAASLGCEVTMLSTSKGKEADARRLGAHEFALTSREGHLQEAGAALRPRSSTPSRRRTTTTPTWGCSRWTGPWCCWACRRSRRRWPPSPSSAGGAAWPARPSAASPRPRRCSTTAPQHGITADVEVIPVARVNEAYDRMLKNDVRYRFVLDLATL